MEMSKDLKIYFVERMKVIFEEDPCFKNRLESFFPLFGLKWCLIILNEFTADAQRRIFAGAQIKRFEQLERAKILTQRIKDIYKEFPYGQ